MAGARTAGSWFPAGHVYACEAQRLLKSYHVRASDNTNGDDHAQALLRPGRLLLRAARGTRSDQGCTGDDFETQVVRLHKNEQAAPEFLA